MLSRSWPSSLLGCVALSVPISSSRRLLCWTETVKRVNRLGLVEEPSHKGRLFLQVPSLHTAEE